MEEKKNSSFKIGLLAFISFFVGLLLFYMAMHLLVAIDAIFAGSIIYNIISFLNVGFMGLALAALLLPFHFIPSLLLRNEADVSECKMLTGAILTGYEILTLISMILAQRVDRIIISIILLIFGLIYYFSHKEKKEDD